MNPIEVSTIENKKEENKKEDKKALPKLILLTIISGIVGGCLSSGLIKTMEILTSKTSNNLVEVFHNAQMSLSKYAGFTAIGLAIILSLVSFSLYHRSKKIVQTQNIDDEEVHRQVEKKLSTALLLISLNTIFSYLMFGIAFYCIVIRERFDTTCIISVILAFVSFIFQTVSTSINQQKVVNLEKEMNPEKKGSVYDFQFHKKWMNSCDEAERFYAYKCAFSAYQTTQVVCLVLSVFLVLLGSVFPIGLLPLICVIIIWGVSTIVYIIQTMKVDQM